MELGGHLPIITSAEENYELQQLVQQPPPVGVQTFTLLWKGGAVNQDRRCMTGVSHHKSYASGELDSDFSAPLRTLRNYEGVARVEDCAALCAARTGCKWFAVNHASGTMDDGRGSPKHPCYTQDLISDTCPLPPSRRTEGEPKIEGDYADFTAFSSTLYALPDAQTYTSGSRATCAAPVEGSFTAHVGKSATAQSSQTKLEDVDVADCERACCEYEWCLGFDYQGRTCYFDETTKALANSGARGRYWIDWPDITFYERPVGRFENYVASVGGVTVGGVVHPRAEACPAFEKTEGFHLGAKGELNHHWLAGATVGDCEIACCAQQWCISFDYSASEQICYLSWNSHLDHDLVAAEDGSDWAYYFRSGAEGRFANFPIDPPRAESCGAYRVYPGKAVAGHNVEHHWGVSVADCEALCCRYTWCVSFDYAIEHHECYLQDFGRSSNDFESNEAYDFYERPDRFGRFARAADADAGTVGGPTSSATACVGSFAHSVDMAISDKNDEAAG